MLRFISYNVHKTQDMGRARKSLTTKFNAMVPFFIMTIIKLESYKTVSLWGKTDAGHIHGKVMTLFFQKT